MICPKCGDTGRTKSGERCDCKKAAEKISFDVIGNIDFIPASYTGVLLEQNLINNVTEDYAVDLMSLHDSIVHSTGLKKNHFLYAPMNSSKTIFAYSVMQHLHRFGMEIYPYLDVNELRLVMAKLDSNAKTIPYFDSTTVDPFRLYDVPVLFVKTPIRPDINTYETLHTIIDRRARRGRGTLIISDIPWEVFTVRDRYNYLKGLVGNGEHKTILLREYARREV